MTHLSVFTFCVQCLTMMREAMLVLDQT